jgi:Trypsin-like peptidase domain
VRNVGLWIGEIQLGRPGLHKSIDSLLENAEYDKVGPPKPMYKRSRTYLFLVVAVVLFPLNISVAAQDARLVARTVLPSVVMLEMRDKDDKPLTLGSGFFVRPGVIATNYHVVVGATKGFAKIVGRSTIYEIEGTVGLDEKRDLVLLKIKGVVGKPLVLADISKVEIGQQIFALGNPKGLEGTISPGIISAKSLRQIGGETLLQITAPISPGSSGGPVVNASGQVVGVASASLANGQNLNFAVPASFLSQLLATASSVKPLPIYDLFADLADAYLKEHPTKTTRDPSVEETTAWLQDNLVGQRGTYMKGAAQITEASFSGCSMSFAIVTTSKYSTTTDSMTFSFGAVDTVFESGNAVMGLLNRQVLVRTIKDVLYGTREESFDRDNSFIIWVDDKNIRGRIITAMQNLQRKCQTSSGKEPF